MQKLLFLLVSLALPIVASAQGPIQGVVRDSSGGLVAGAAVLVRTPGSIEQHAVTGPEGRFTLTRALPAGAEIVVRAGGFGEKAQALNGNREIEIVLEPAR